MPYPLANDRRHRFRFPNLAFVQVHAANDGPGAERLVEGEGEAGAEGRAAGCTGRGALGIQRPAVWAGLEFPGRSRNTPPRPLAVLLAEPTATRQVWYGWLVTAETDYAGDWDLLLGSEDEPCDPLARMVRLWNPVHVYLPSVSRVLAELTPARLAAVRALAVDCVTAPEPDPALAQPGRIVRRQVAGHWIHTGAPLGGPNDPRHAYQRLYHAYAAAVREPARLAHAQPTLTVKLLAGLKHLAQSLGLSLTAAPAPVMGEATAEIHRLGDWLELELHENPDEAGILTLRIRNLQATPCRVQIVRQGEVRRESILEAHQDARILVEAAPGTELVLLDESGERLRWPLAK